MIDDLKELETLELMLAADLISKKGPEHLADIFYELSSDKLRLHLLDKVAKNCAKFNTPEVLMLHIELLSYLSPEEIFLKILSLVKEHGVESVEEELRSHTATKEEFFVCYLIFKYVDYARR